MYLEFIVGFGAGLCLIGFIVFFANLISDMLTNSKSIGIKNEIDHLLVNIGGLRKEYSDSRWDQIKKLGNDFCRNSRAFKSSYESLIQTPETKAKFLDNEMENLIQKCKKLMENINLIPSAAGKNGFIVLIIKITGIAVCVIINYLVFLS